MNGFEFNKILASILISLLVLQISGLFSDFIITKDKSHEQNILGIDVSSQQTAQTSSEKPLEAVAPLLKTASVENGEKIAKKCIQCHSFEKNGANKIGPNLFGIINNKIAHRDDFAYSKSMKEHGGKWDVESLKEFLHKPRKFINNTKMSFIGLHDMKEIADVIAYLNSLSNNPIDLKTL